MAYLLTRMPSTGNVMNVTHVTDIRGWDAPEVVEILTDAEYEALPRCPTCGEPKILRRCADCR